MNSESEVSAAQIPLGSNQLTILQGDALDRLKELPSESVQCCVTSPPYFGLRDYKVAGQIGLEASPAEFVFKLVGVFREVRRVLASAGTLWMVIGDSYANDGKWGGHTGGKHVKALHNSPIGRNKRYTGLKPKNLIGIPWMVAFALRDDGWYLRSEITWCKKAPMPESVTDRPTSATEKIFLFSKSQKYFYDADAVRIPAAEDTHDRYLRARGNGHKFEDGAPGQKPHSEFKARPNHSDKQRGHSRRHAGFNDRWDAMDRTEQQANGANLRNYWVLGPEPYPEAHFATFPSEIPRRAILAGCPVGGTVLDCFAGSFTTCMVALELGRKTIGIELNSEYIKLGMQRCDVTPGLPLA